MTDFLLYLIQSSIVFSCLYVLYKIVCSRATFYGINRILLISIPFIALLTPFSYLIIPEIPSKTVQIPVFNDFIAHSENTIIHTIEETTVTSYDLNSILIYVYIVGASVIFFRLSHSLWLIIRLKKQSKSKPESNYQLVYTNQQDSFSFLNWIFIPKHQKDNSNNLIITHEKAHVRLKHSVDIIFSELYCAFFWFNPLVYAYRKSLKSIHEYQADAWVLNKNVKTSSYLQTLLQNIELQTSNSLYNHFNQSVIKKRIDMITKNPTPKVYKLTYSLFIICSVILCMAFTKTETVDEFLNTTIPQLNFPAVKEVNSPPSLFPVKDKNKKDITSYYGTKRKLPKHKNKIAHRGIDIRAAVGTPVIATADGVITKSTYEGNWGNLIIINHSDGYQTWYGHLQGFNVKKDQSVKKGDIIGYVGNTGLSTGPHLHYEVHLHEKHMDPMDFIKE